MLKSFSNPPVIEVVFSLEFTPLPLSQSHFGMFWSEIRNEFPKPVDDSPVPPSDQPPGFQLTIGVPQLRRTLFYNSKNNKVFQLQPNRITFNWRYMGEEYPLYQALEEEFLELQKKFELFVAKSNLASLEYLSSELTYTNLFKIGTQNLTFNNHQFKEVKHSTTDQKIEAVMKNEQVIWIENIKTDDALGELRTILNHGQIKAIQSRPTDDTFLQLNYQERRSDSSTFKPIESLRRGHQIIVSHFNYVTPLELQREWGVIDNNSN